MANLHQSSGDVEELTCEELVDSYWDEFFEVSQYVKSHQLSRNTKVFSYLALLNAYVPESYLLMCQCQEILGPPDPIHGGPPFEEQMEPFTVFIKRSILSTGQHVCMIRPAIAEASVQLLAELGVTRTATVKSLMVSLSGHQAQPDTIQFIKDLLTKREMGEKGKDKFSRLIEDIRKKAFYNAVSILKTASGKFTTYHHFPQTLSRLYYTSKLEVSKLRDDRYVKAKEWAVKAIERAPNNSYMADTLGQVHKNRLMWEALSEQAVLDEAEKAIEAFEAVEEKANNEVRPEMEDAGLRSVSNSFNNRGRFGYIHVAKIVYEKIVCMPNQSVRCRNLISNLEPAVEDRFDFFEWYLAYSKPDIKTLEPSYFWKNIALCYGYYTKKVATQSTSFAGLLDCLYHGLSMSKGFNEAEKTAPDVEAIRDDLKANPADVKRAERYILSNIMLSNKTLSSPTLALEKELKMIMNRFLVEEVRSRSPEFYLLVLLLFWPGEQQPLLVQEEEEENLLLGFNLLSLHKVQVQVQRDDGDVEEQQAAEDDGSEDKTWEDKDNEEQETGGETAQPPPPDLMLDLDLNKYVTLMKESYEKQYGNYLRGRYLLPLFFLGKGSGLSRWVHRSRLDAILESWSEATGNSPNIDEMWSSGKVWELPEIQDILLPVRGEVCSPMMPQEHVEQEVFACVGGKRIKVTTEGESNVSRFYIGFTIQGPLAFSGL